VLNWEERFGGEGKIRLENEELALRNLKRFNKTGAFKPNQEIAIPRAMMGQAYINLKIRIRPFSN